MGCQDSAWTNLDLGSGGVGSTCGDLVAMWANALVVMASPLWEGERRLMLAHLHHIPNNPTAACLTYIMESEGVWHEEGFTVLLKKCCRMSCSAADICVLLRALLEWRAWSVALCWCSVCGCVWEKQDCRGRPAWVSGPRGHLWCHQKQVCIQP